MDVNFTTSTNKILSGKKRQMICRSTPKWNSVRVGQLLAKTDQKQKKQRRIKCRTNC